MLESNDLKERLTGYDAKAATLQQQIEDEQTRTEEIDKLMSERTLDKVSIEIKEGTLTNKGATIVIKDRNELPYSYGEAYKLEKLEEKEWKALWNSYYAKNDVAYIIGRDEKTEIDLNWEEYYKELEKGKYRILMQVIPGDDNTIISTEFEIK